MRRLQKSSQRLAVLIAIIFALPVLIGCASGQENLPVPQPDVLTERTAVASPPTGARPSLAPFTPAAPVEPTTPHAPAPEIPSSKAPAVFHGAALILSPGDTSLAVSPLKAQIMVRVHPAGIVHIDLVGKGDLLYARRLLDMSDKSGQEILIQAELPFETLDGGEPARLVVRLLDGAGRTIALTSANITLLSGGTSVIEPSRASGWIDILTPLEGEKIEGKIAHVIASVTPVNDQPIVAELITEEGTAINTRLVRLPAGSQPGESIQLDFELPYAVSDSTPCLLTLYQASYHQIEGKLMLASVPVTLLP